MDNISIRTEGMIQVLDALTGWPLHVKNIRLKMSRTVTKMPIYKGDGYYLFLQLPEPETLLRIDAFGYQPFEQQFGTLMECGTISQIYLKPDKQYPLSREIYSIIGRAYPGRIFYLICKESMQQRQLAEDYKAGMTELAFWNRGNLMENDMEFQIQSQKNHEFVRLSKKLHTTTNRYLLENSLTNSYCARTSVLFPAKRMITDTMGEYIAYWLRKKGLKEQISCEIWSQDGRCLESIELKAGMQIAVERQL